MACQVVCVTEAPLSLQLELNASCATARVAATGGHLGPYYVSAEGRGVHGRMFSDFGEGFVVSDLNGDPPKSAMIASIDKGNPGIVTTLPDELHDLETGDFVTFSEVVMLCRVVGVCPPVRLCPPHLQVQGLEGLNGCEPLPVTVITSHSFSVGDISGVPGTHTMGGVMLQVKQPKVFNFKRCVLLTHHCCLYRGRD